MKSYSYKLQLLLILLLITVNTTLISAFDIKSLTNIPIIRKFANWAKKKAAHEIGKEVAENVWNYTLNNIENSEERSSSPQGNDEEIDGLYIIKEYLSEFGYLQQPGPYDNKTNQETTSAIKIYQQNFNLQAKGNLNYETLQQMVLPRCGVPDMNYAYNLSGTNTISWPKGNQWFPKGKNNLTYGFAPESEIPPDVIEVFKNAFMRWSTTTKVLNFTKVTSYDDANIKIGLYIYNEAVTEVVLGDTVISMQLNSSVMSGEIRFDASKIWVVQTGDDNGTLSWEDEKFDVETVAMHQIGHLLGLNHSFENDSIMYPSILPSNQRKVEITSSDNQTIQNLYTTAIKSDVNYGYVGSSSGLITSLFLGFAFMAMLI